VSQGGDERVARLLGGAGYRRLLATARERLEEAGEEARSFTLADLDLAERTAVAGLLGWSKVPAGPLKVSLSDLDAAIAGSAAGVSLREALTILGGPLRDRPAERAQAGAVVEARWAEARVRLEVAGRQELLPWLEGLRGSGAVTRAARGDEGAEAPLLERAVGAALRLPSSGVLLQVLAAEVTGDPHALDAGRPLASLFLRAAAAVAGWPSVPAAAESRRVLLREVGVDRDPLSSDVLLLGLRPEGPARLARHLRECAEDGEPRRVTLRELSGARLEIAPGSTVFVCENPAVVAAAATGLGRQTAAIICLEGVPSTAASQLLEGLHRSGAQLRVRADFDWAGLRIAGRVMARTAALPWRFGLADYQAALAAGKEGPVLEGAAVPATWDQGLTEALARTGRSVPEELLVGELLEDLALAT
jgi:uncharacterized protein (TIGR02679 family)